MSCVQLSEGVFPVVYPLGLRSWVSVAVKLLLHYKELLGHPEALHLLATAIGTRIAHAASSGRSGRCAHCLEFV